MSDYGSWLFIGVDFPAVCFVRSQNRPADVSIPLLWLSLTLDDLKTLISNGQTQEKINGS